MGALGERSGVESKALGVGENSPRPKRVFLQACCGRVRREDVTRDEGMW